MISIPDTSSDIRQKDASDLSLLLSANLSKPTETIPSPYTSVKIEPPRSLSSDLPILQGSLPPGKEPFFIVFYPRSETSYLCDMFVEFLSSDIADRPICATSALGRLVVSTDAESVRVSLSHENEGFYSATLYAYDGAVYVDDLASVIESLFLRLGWHSHSIRISVSASGHPDISAFMDINCLYCSYDMPDDFDPSVSFFTCLQAQRVPPSAVLKVYGQVAKNNPVRFGVSGTLADGTRAACNILSTAGDGYISVDIPDIISQCKSVYSFASVSIVSVVYGSMSKSYFICEMPDCLEFRFRNCFNVPETIFVSGSSVMKTEVSRDSAFCAGKILQYNHLTTRTYEHTTAPLTRMEAAAMSQLIESMQSAVVTDGTEYPVIIDDHTSEVSNDDSSLNALKFTWRFTGRRPRLFGETLSPLLESFGIFTTQFTEPYQ